MMNELLTAREVQDLLKVDRTTVYRMLKDGRLTGVKVGQQWRFPQADVEALLSGCMGSDEPQPSRPADVLPLHCIQPIQDVFSEVAGIGAVTVAPDGTPLTTPSSPCDFCALVQSTPSGWLACVESRRRLAQGAPGEFARCHAGLAYAQAPIAVDDEPVAMIFVGQCHLESPDPTIMAAQVTRLSAEHSLDAAALQAAAATIPTLNPRSRNQMRTWLTRVAGTFQTIARERASLLDRLRRIAAITIVDTI